MDRWLGVNAERGQRLEIGVKPIILDRRFASRLTIPAPEQRHPASFADSHFEPFASLRASCRNAKVDSV
jgi:hypothetical protein